MRKYVKIISLIFLIQLLGGWSWKNAVQNMPNGLDVKYEANDQKVVGLESIEFKVSNNKLTASYVFDNNSVSNQIIGDGNNYNGINFVNGYEFVYNDFNFEEYFKNYDVNTTIYVCTDVGTGQYKVSNGSITIDNSCIAYEEKSTVQDATVPDENELIEDENGCKNNIKKCINGTAVYCKQDSVTIKSNNKKVIIERGETNKGSKYIYVFYNGVAQKGKPFVNLNANNNYMKTDSNDNTWIVEGTQVNLLFQKDGCDYKGIYLADEPTDGHLYLYITVIGTEAQHGSNIGSNSNDYDAGRQSITSNNQLPSGDPSLVTNPNNIEGMDICSQNGVKQVLHILGVIGFIGKLVIPLLLIIMGTIDLIKALKDPDDKSMKDQFSMFIKRILAAIIIFLAPTIINLAFSLIDNANNSNFTGCTDCLFDPFGGNCNYTKLGQDN